MGYNPPKPPKLKRPDHPPPPPIHTIGLYKSYINAKEKLGPRYQKDDTIQIVDQHGGFTVEVTIDMDGNPIFKKKNEDGSYTSIKCDKDSVDIDSIDAKLFYNSYIPLKHEWDASIELAKYNHKNGIIQIEGSVENNTQLTKTVIPPEPNAWFPPNELINESTGEVTYDYVSEEQKKQWPEPKPNLGAATYHTKKSADIDPPKKKNPSKGEWDDIFPPPKKKSLWDRLVDSIIRDIVWGRVPKKTKRRRYTASAGPR